jgi:hypothetical protein
MNECLKVYLEEKRKLTEANKEGIRELARRKGICYMCMTENGEEQYGGLGPNCYDKEFTKFLKGVCNER